MTHNYTENQIIKFIYKECDLFEKLEMEFAMEDDSTVMESYQTLKSGYDNLSRVKFSPRNATVDFILKYSSLPVV